MSRHADGRTHGATGERDRDVIAALTTLRDAGLVTDRGQLNGAWRALTGRTDPAESNTRRPANVGRCDACGQAGAIPWHEPVGTWHPDCRPQLWRPAERAWVAPSCAVCGQPAGRPTTRWRCAAPRCREHAPAPMRRYLAHTDEGMAA